MHDSQMHAADLAGVVIDQSNRPLGEATAEAQLLTDLALHGIVISRLIEMLALIRVVYMAADADRRLRHEPLLTGFRTARIMQDASAMPEDRVGDDLLERGILLRRAARHKEVVLLFHKGGKVVIHPPAQTLKTSQAIEKFAFHHQHLFLCFAHGRRHCRERPNPQGKTSQRRRVFLPLASIGGFL